MEDTSKTKGNVLSFQTRYIVEALQSLMHRIQADMDVPRERVDGLVEKARELTRQPENWPQGETQAAGYLSTVEGMARKIHQLLDYRALREEGLIRAVPM